MMDGGAKVRHLRGGGDNWASEQCIPKVEEMLSRAILHQEDLWNMLHCPPGSSIDAPPVAEGVALHPELLKSLKAKLENSMDWCHLALCRLKEVLARCNGELISRTRLTPVKNSRGGSGHSYGSDSDSELVHPDHGLMCSSGNIKLPSPVSPLDVPLRNGKESLVIPPPTVSPLAGSGGKAGSFWSIWSPRSFFSTEVAQLPHTGEDNVMGMNPDRAQEGQNFAQMDSDWMMVADQAASGLVPSGHIQQSSSASCLQNELDHLHLEGSLESGGNATDSRDGEMSIHPKVGEKRVREANGEDPQVNVAFQKLDGAKRGIPDDGHRGWKKYGNKVIQNSNYCRGYYKCTMKDCSARKMVQQTDNDPELFEVTYVGIHTCSRSSQTRKRSAVASRAQAKVPPRESDDDHQEGAETSDRVPTASTMTKELRDSYSIGAPGAQTTIPNAPNAAQSQGQDSHEDQALYDDQFTIDPMFKWTSIMDSSLSPADHTKT